jgi:predicted NBD/HSP70 family sugar kinase
VVRGNGRIGHGNGDGRGVAIDELRRHNLAIVLDHLHLGGRASRSQLTHITGLNRSTIADLIGELEELGVVSEGPRTIATGPGRPSPVVRLRPERAVVLAIEVSVDSIAVATVGIGGHVFNQLRVSRPRGHVSPHDTVRHVASLAQPLLGSLPRGHRIVGVGCAIVGTVRPSDGFVYMAPNLGWRDIALGELLDAELGIDKPIVVANDADLGALSEHRRGRPDTRHLVFISGEVGIGCGVIINGAPLSGIAGYAGEAGHTLINPGGRVCGCGSTGCWETEAGEGALLRRAGLSGRVSGLAAVETVVEMAEAGDERVLKAIHETGRWLGYGIANLVNVFNPEAVVLGGLYHRLFDYLEAGVRSGTERALEASLRSAAIVKSTYGFDAPLLGAAEIVLLDLIADPAGVLVG